MGSGLSVGFGRDLSVGFGRGLSVGFGRDLSIRFGSGLARLLGQPGLVGCVQQAIAENRAVVRFIAVTAHFVVGIALDCDDRAGRVHGLDHADVACAAGALDVEEDQVAGCGLARRFRSVETDGGQCANPLFAVGFPGKGFLRDIRIVQAEGEEHGTPIAVIRAVPVAVAGIALPLALFIQDEVDVALPIAQLGARHGQQIIRPDALGLYGGEGSLPLPAGLGLADRAGKRCLGAGGISAGVGNLHADGEGGDLLGGEGLNAQRVAGEVRLVKQEDVALADGHVPLERGNAALQAQCEDDLVPAEAGETLGRRFRREFAAMDDQRAIQRRGLLAACGRQAHNIQAGVRHSAAEGGCLRIQNAAGSGHTVQRAERIAQFGGVLCREGPLALFAFGQTLRALKGAERKGVAGLFGGGNVRFHGRLAGRGNRLPGLLRGGNVRFHGRLAGRGNRLPGRFRGRDVGLLGQKRRLGELFRIAGSLVHVRLLSAIQYGRIAAVRMHMFFVRLQAAGQILPIAGVGVDMLLQAADRLGGGGDGRLNQPNHHAQRERCAQHNPQRAHPSAARAEEHQTIDELFQGVLIPIHDAFSGFQTSIQSSRFDPGARCAARSDRWFPPP